jgi:CDGSH-type Zn-finger protein
MSQTTTFSPIAVDLEKDKNYSWCSCGHSESEPFCDGSHRKHNATPSLKFSVTENKTAHLCTCKLTKNAPYCDGSHKG